MSSYVMFSGKGKRKNVIEDFKFSFHKCLRNDIEWWRFVKRTCKSNCKSENEKTVSFNYDHDKTNINYNLADSK